MEQAELGATILHFTKNLRILYIANKILIWGFKNKSFRRKDKGMMDIQPYKCKIYMAWKNKEYKQFSKSISEELSRNSDSVDTKKIYSYLEFEFQNNLREILRKFVKQFKGRKEWEDLPQNEEFFQFLENDKENFNLKQSKVYVIIRIMMMDFKFEKKNIGRTMKKN